MENENISLFLIEKFKLSIIDANVLSGIDCKPNSDPNKNYNTMSENIVN